MKIIELTLNEDIEGGVDTVSLVQEPAIEEDFYAFNAQKYYFETYDDYPQAAVNAAAMGIKRNEALGNPCATQVGKVRAQQLVNGEKLSLDTIRRMRSFLIRHKDNYELARDRKDYDACGYISYLLWGGEAALPWAEKKLSQAGETFKTPLPIKEIDKDYSFNNIEHEIFKHIFAQEFDLEVGTLPTYVNEPVKQRKLVGPLMIPDKLIRRIDPDTDEEYFVYFTEDTIKKLSERFMKNGDIHSSNIEHNGIAIDGVYLTETWIVEDPEKDKSNLYNQQYPKGTWMGMYKIDNEDVWVKIENKEIKGFSVEGWFTEKFSRYFSEDTTNDDEEMVDGIVDLLLMVEDMDNRRKIAKKVLDDFVIQGIDYEEGKFLRRVGLDVKDQILKFASQVGYTYAQLEKFANARAGGGSTDIEEVIPSWARDPRVQVSLYKYEGNISPRSRDFCAQMVNLGRYYTQADIEAMSSIAVNAGFGPRGASTYDIWKYLGGVNCHHRWQRYTYTFRNDKFELVSQSRAPGLAGTRMIDRPRGGRL